MNQWSCSSPDFSGSNDLQIEPTDCESSRFTVKPVPAQSRTEFSQSEDEGNTDLFSGSILNSEMRQRRPSRSILQSPERERISREKSVVWKDNLVEYRYIDGNPVDRGLVNWGSVCYAVLLIVSSYVVYCLLHSVGIKPRGLRWREGVVIFQSLVWILRVSETMHVLIVRQNLIFQIIS